MSSLSSGSPSPSPPPAAPPAGLDWLQALSYVQIAMLDFEKFSEKISSGSRAQSDARILALRRHKEDGHVRHEFVTVQVSSNAQIFWLRIERRVRQKAKFLTFQGSVSQIDSWDTVSQNADTNLRILTPS